MCYSITRRQSGLDRDNNSRFIGGAPPSEEVDEDETGNDPEMWVLSDGCLVSLTDLVRSVATEISEMDTDALVARLATPSSGAAMLCYRQLPQRQLAERRIAASAMSTSDTTLTRKRSQRAESGDSHV